MALIRFGCSFLLWSKNITKFIGGCLLVPVLWFLYPQETPATVTSIALTVAFFNSLSGSVACGRLKRIDYRSGLMFSAASVPGAIIGANITAFLTRGLFQNTFGVTLALVAIYPFVHFNFYFAII
jgi:uncharacterized membrane protein YfcA